MKYCEKYPDMVPIDEERGGIIRARYTGRCCVCGERTKYIEINYEAYFCSEECLRKMDDMACTKCHFKTERDRNGYYNSW